MERITLFVDVMLPIPLPGLYTYRVPFDFNKFVKIGQRVVVQFGKKKVYTALIKKIHQTPPQNYSVKYILSILDSSPIVNKIQFQFWDWISSYYMCQPGEVMNAALPSALKLASETKILLNPDFDGDFSLLNDKEYLIAEALEIRKILTITEVTDIVEQLKVIPLIKTLIEKGVVVIEEQLTNRYKPKIETYVRLSEKYKNNEQLLSQVFDDLSKRAFKQLELLMSFVSITQNADDNLQEISRPKLLKSINASSSLLKALEEKGIFETFEKVKSR